MKATKSDHPTNLKLIEIIRRTQIDSSYQYRHDDLVDEKILFLRDHCSKILDVGKSSRHRFEMFQQGQAVTMDINQFEGYPDIIDDLCDLKHIGAASFNGVVCSAVLEHVYDPQSAAHNLHKILKSPGYCLAYVPFLTRYHGPANLEYQDYFRFSRDGIAYLFREFSSVTIYPVRGRYSTMINLLGSWKTVIEARLGSRVNRVVDGIGSFFQRPPNPELQASGYTIWATK